MAKKIDPTPDDYRLIEVFPGWTVNIAANRGDKEPRRLDRLERVTYASIRKGLRITHLYDDKGRLSANFHLEVNQNINQNAVNKLRKLWAAENEYIIEAIYTNFRFVEGEPNPALEMRFPSCAACQFKS